MTADTGPCIVWIAGAGADYADAGCWADHKLRSKGRPGLARGLRIALFALKVGLAVHNARKVR